MIHLENDYAMASLIHEQRIRDAEVDRAAAAATRSIREAIRETYLRLTGVTPIDEPAISIHQAA